MYSAEMNGEVMSFGTSGWLYQSNKLMYDRGTKTLWTNSLASLLLENWSEVVLS